MRSTFFVYSKDKTLLKGCEWNSIRKPVAIIFFVHGLGGHAMRFEELAVEYNKYKIAVYSLDLRGHGNSEGKRGHVNSLDEYFEDIESGLKRILSSYGKDIPLFLFGNSMGGLVALMYSLRTDLYVRGLILTAPWFQLVKEPSSLRIWLLKILNRVIPWVVFKNGIKVADFSGNPDKQGGIKKDILSHRYISPRLFFEVYQNAKKVTTKKIPNLAFPIVLFHGDKDPVTNFSSSEKFCTLNKPWTTFVQIPGGKHDIFMNSRINHIVDLSVDWIHRELIKTIN